ncbi:MAG: DUF2497 domain-containing protein [Acetobacteraceae bacterium]
MSATEPAPPPGADPSMEDILASIRRILSEEEQPNPAEARPGDEAASPPEADVLVLEPSMMLPETSHPQPEQPSVALAEAPEPVVALESTGLVAPETARAAAAAVAGLVATLAGERGTQVYRGGPTIEDLVRAELRSLLKEWLDTHLPPMVERLVRVEIERVVGRSLP